MQRQKHRLLHRTEVLRFGMAFDVAKRGRSFLVFLSFSRLQSLKVPSHHQTIRFVHQARIWTAVVAREETA